MGGVGRGLLFLTLVAVSASLAAGPPATFLPLVPRPRPVDVERTRLRGAHTLWLYAPSKGARLRLSLEAVQVGRYTTEVVAAVPGVAAARLVLRPERAGGPTAGTLDFAAPREGLIPVEVSSHSNAVVVRPLSPNPWLVVEASRRKPLHVISRVGRLHFFVPSETERFAVFGRGGGGRENIRLRVFYPDGRLAAEGAARGEETLALRLEAPAPARGKVWSLTADRPPQFDGVFEDGYLWLSEEVPGWVSVGRDLLLVPFCHGLRQPPRLRDPNGDVLKLGLNIEPPRASRLSATLLAEGGREVSAATARPQESLSLRLAPSLPVGDYTLRVGLEAANGETLAEAVSPVLLTPALLFVGGAAPIVEVEPLDRGERPPAIALRRNVRGKGLRMSVEVSLSRSPVAQTPGNPSAETILSRKLVLGDDAVVQPPAGLPNGLYQWKAVARDEAGRLLDVGFAHFLLWGGRLFKEVRPASPPPLPVLGDEDRERGFVGFVPQATDAIPYNHRPTADELQRSLRIEAARGEFEPATFGLWAFEPQGDLRVELSPPRHLESGATLACDLRLARHWAQRTSWRTTAFKIVPELLDENRPFPLAVGQVKQVWLTVSVPPDARPGAYRGKVVVRGSKGQWERPLAVRVRPFALDKPPGVHWGLYSDSGRWKRYSPAKLGAELRDIVAHGITTLMCYPIYHSRVSLEGGTLEIEADEFFRLMAEARRAGLGPPWVMSLQALPGLLRRLLPGKKLGDPEFKRLYQDIARWFAQEAKRRGVGECVWHAIDEPGSPETIAIAVAELGYLKELGLTTFTTAGPVPPELDRVLDVRCYGASYIVGSPGSLARRAAETRASGDRLWFYGSGCYTGQDGNLAANRFVTGFLFWRSGAEAEWSWTFLRPKGDPFNDFDGQSQREHKDACTVYPSPGDQPPIPTLQWEGIREGVDDYRYAWTAEKLARERGDAEALAEIGRLRQSVPVSRSPTAFSAAEAQALRAEFAAMIERLTR